MIIRASFIKYRGTSDFEILIKKETEILDKLGASIKFKFCYT